MFRNCKIPIPEGRPVRGLFKVCMGFRFGLVLAGTMGESSEDCGGHSS